MIDWGRPLFGLEVVRSWSVSNDYLREEDSGDPVGEKTVGLFCGQGHRRAHKPIVSMVKWFL